MLHIAKLNGNVFKFREAKKWYKDLKKLDGKEVLVSIKEYKKQNYNTDLMRKFYFGVVLAIIADWSGYTKEECHDFCKAKFLTDKSGPIPRIGSVSRGSITTKKFKKLLEDIQLYFSTNHGVVIPDPNDKELERLLEYYDSRNIP